MTWTKTNPVTIGNPTKKADYDALWDNISFVQRVNFQTSATVQSTVAIPLDDTIPNSAEGVEVMTLAVTPQNSSYILDIEVNGFAGSVNAGVYISTILLQDTSTSALAAATVFADNAAGSAVRPLQLRHRMVAGTTAETTFKVRIGTNSGAEVTLNGYNGSRLFGGKAVSSITITELKA